MTTLARRSPWRHPRAPARRRRTRRRPPRRAVRRDGRGCRGPPRPARPPPVAPRPGPAASSSTPTRVRSPAMQQDVGAGAGLGQAWSEPATRVRPDVHVTDGGDAYHSRSASSGAAIGAHPQVGDDLHVGTELASDGDRGIAALRSGQLPPQHHAITGDAHLERLVAHPGVVGQRLVEAGHQILDRLGHVRGLSCVSSRWPRPSRAAAARPPSARVRPPRARSAASDSSRFGPSFARSSR